MIWEWGYVIQIFPDLLKGLRLTLVITVLASLLGLVLGFLLAFVIYRKVPLLSQTAKIYVQVIRNTPLLVQVYLFFFALPEFGILISPVASGVIVLGSMTACYMSEIYRAGIEAVPREQWDATTALSLPTRRVWLRIILPQALPPVLPALGNNVNEMLKLTAYASAIGVIELFGQGLRVAELTYRYLVPFTMVGLMYLTFSVTVTVLLRRFELRNAKRNSSWSKV